MNTNFLKCFFALFTFFINISTSIAADHEYDVYFTDTMPVDAEMFGTGRIGGIALDRNGYIYVANQDSHVWRINPHGNAELFYDGMLNSGGIGITQKGDVLVGDSGSSEIIKIDRQGNADIYADENLAKPVGLLEMSNGDVYAANCGAPKISKITPDGLVTDFLVDGRLRCANGITVDPEGNFYVVSLGNSLILRITPEGEVSEFANLPGDHLGHIVFGDGALYVTQLFSHVVYKVDMDGTYKPISGNGLEGTVDGFQDTSTMAFPNAIAYSRREGILYVNNLVGDMQFRENSRIIVRRIYLPTPQNLLLRAAYEGGVEEMRRVFEGYSAQSEEAAGSMISGAARTVSHLLSLGEKELGFGLLDIFVEMDSDKIGAYNFKGRMLAVHGTRDAAREAFEKVLELDPENQLAKQRLRIVEEVRKD